ncbi:MAG: lipopolysaccharide biosynthesis protein [Syntrophaceae bacterium]|nr:lipopolysaccharide biosynthesis protein [Syntrophaceae bacterium]
MARSWFGARQNYLPEPQDGSGVGSQVASGSLWSGMEVAATTALQFVRSIIFARILMPADFGILSLATVFTEFILIFANFGFNASVIYHRSLKKEDLSTCWWGNVLIDGVVAAVCCTFGLLSGGLTGDRTTGYTIALLALQFVVLSLGSINTALMRRQFMFKQLALTRFANVVLSFLSAWFFVGVLEWGVYGLVGGMIAGNALMTLLVFYCLPWLPSFTFSFATLRRHISYGGWFLCVNLVTYANGNMDKAIVGTYLNVTQLGFYEYASNIPLMVANKLSQVLNSVLLPAFSSLQNNLQQLGALLAKVYRYNAIIIFPVLTGIGLVAPDFVLAAYGDRWQPVVMPLRFFCLFGMLRIFINPFYALCNGIGMPRLPFKWTVLYFPANALLMFLGVKYFGALGAIQARLFLPVFMTFTLGEEILRLIKVNYFDLLKSIWPSVFCCSIMAISVFLTQEFISASVEVPLVRLLIQIPVGALSYALSLMIFFRLDVYYILGKLKPA